MNESIPLERGQNIPLALVGQCFPKGRYNKSKEFDEFTISKYRKRGKGITFEDLLSTGLAYDKKQAQTTLKYYLKKKLLFTLGARRPQEYFSTSIRSEIIKNEMSKKKNNNKKLSKVLSTKLSVEDYNAFQMLTKLEYEAGLIKEESPSELLRFTIRHILKQVNNQPEYLTLKQEQQQQKQVQDNQQQHLHSQVILPSPIITAASHQHQVPNISNRNNLVGHKMTRWKLSSLLSTQTNQLNYSRNSI